jgi:hypothetical protein
MWDDEADGTGNVNLNGSDVNGVRSGIVNESESPNMNHNAHNHNADNHNAHHNCLTLKFLLFEWGLAVLGVLGCVGASYIDELKNPYKMLEPVLCLSMGWLCCSNEDVL